MSRRRMSMTSSMPPPPDRDVVMGPPPLPLPQSAHQQPQSTPRGYAADAETNEKYSRLKRRFFELENKYKDTLTELQRSGERNLKHSEERDCLLDRIIELEHQVGELGGQSAPNSSPGGVRMSSAYPRSLLSSRARATFHNNLQQAHVEEETDDHSADPLLSSRHLGPTAQKRVQEEERDRAEDEARERRATKRTRTTAKGKELPVPAHQPTPAPPMMVFETSNSPPVHEPPVQSAVIVRDKQGTRLRIKPPVRPPSDPEQGTPSAPKESQSPPNSSPMSPPEQVPVTEPNNTNGLVRHESSGPASPPSLVSSPPIVQQPPSPSLATRTFEVQRRGKPKRLKAHTVTSKTHSIPTIPRDKNKRPLLPLNVGIITVISLGEICKREHFHTERYIFPVGYEITRRYLSTTDPNSDVVYTCSILDGGDGPKFKIIGADLPDRPVIAGTATGAWSSIVKQANAIRNRQHSNSVSGPDFFGLGQNTIKHLIQELQGADQLKDYVWQNFIEGG
ncbi:FYRN-domain-containing protein [Coniophora puteana RWD-64-598 SS2]|uniref:FYRN-domain-containing protein n=1 Tax=Coniophora puteana (strain RWD-64-598) TaxID=741705 RepID=A0A5M3MPW2_CONPW|nr:FYRN-domain-containing protein [Coniophora puteana RWD-64-598 SS2]EIW81222.1 FYRN-domain-containing protein [Coniophora puteana RWD-64-598 SS2]